MVGFIAAGTAVAFFTLLGVGLDDLYKKSFITPSGQSASIAEATASASYGFGEHKNLLVVNITEIGGVDNIDLKDKEHATMKMYVDGEIKHNLDIGIEIKGRRDRKKLNYGIEIWEPDGDGWDDSKAKLIGDEKYEDWILRGGFFEPTLIRDKFAADSPREGDAKYNAELFELVFCNNGKCTYEGVYLLMEEPDRKMLEKTLGWKAKIGVDGKTNCDDGDKSNTPYSESAVFFEYTVQEHKTHQCGPDHIYPEYPKCKDLLATPQCAAFYEYHKDLYEAINTGNVEVLDIPAFAERFLFEMLMSSDDFPFASQFYYSAPKSNKLTPAPPYDYDGFWWRSYTGVSSTAQRPIEFVNRWYYQKDLAPLWKKLATYAPFIEEVKKLEGHVTELNTKFRAIVDQRKAELEAGYWDRNNERWKPYGHGNYMPAVERIDYLTHRNTALTKNTMAEELDFEGAWFQARAQSVAQNLGGLEKVTTANMSTTDAVFAHFAAFLTVGIIFVISGLLWLYMECRDKGKNSYEEVPSQGRG